MKINIKINQFVSFLKEDLGLYLSISFGVFLFILFFEPFSLEAFDFNNRLLFVAGIAAIVFIIMSLVRVAIPWFIHKYDATRLEQVLPPFLNSLIIYLFSLASIVLYLHYLGSVEISFYLVFKIALICLALPVSLRLFDLIKDLRQEVDRLKGEKEIAQQKAEEYRDDYLNKPLEFTAEQGAESLTLHLEDVIAIRSADNYVEIIYTENGVLKKHLIRNTLKKIELLLKPYAIFVRTHRTSIVNSHFISKLERQGYNYTLKIKGLEETIPVSRQYLLKLRELT